MNAFPAAGGLMHLGWVDPGMEDQYVAALEQTVDSVVVWDPGESRVDPRLKLPRLVRAIRRWYRPEARFGNLEVWRHQSSYPPPVEEGDAADLPSGILPVRHRGRQPVQIVDPDTSIAVANRDTLAVSPLPESEPTAPVIVHGPDGPRLSEAPPID
jgi:hypothetical protein